MKLLRTRTGFRKGGVDTFTRRYADKASSIPLRMYSLLETSQEVDQFLNTIHRYVQIGIYVKGYYSKRLNRFQREIIEVCEFYVDDDNKACTNTIYKKSLDGHFVLHNPTKRLIDYMAIQNVMLPDDVFGLGQSGEETGDESTDMSTKDPSLKYDESNRPKPAETNFSIGQVGYQNNNSNKEAADKANQESINVDNQSVVSNDIPTPKPPVYQTVNNQQSNNLKTENGEGSEGATLKPSFTNPEDIVSNVEIL